MRRRRAGSRSPALTPEASTEIVRTYIAKKGVLIIQPPALSPAMS